MTAVVLIALISFIMYEVVSAIDRCARRNYIPGEEIKQKLAQPDKYVPWSREKRMRYYNHEQSLHRKQMISDRPYVSYIETGYIHRRS